MPRACDRGPPAPQLVWHALRPALAPHPWEQSWLVHTARPGLDAGVLRQYIPNACKEGGKLAETRGRSGTAADLLRAGETGLLTAARPEVAGTPRVRTPRPPTRGASHRLSTRAGEKGAHGPPNCCHPWPLGRMPVGEAPRSDVQGEASVARVPLAVPWPWCP